MEKTINDLKINVRPLEEADWDNLNNLCNRRFGTGYLDYKDFLDKIKFPRLNLVAEDKGKAVAMVSMIPTEAHKLAEFMQMDEQELLKDAAGRKMIRYKTAVCDEDYEGKGIIHFLTGEIIRNVKEDNFGVILASVWKYNGKAPASRLLRSFEFKDLGERHMMWYNQKDYECVVCNGPCKCDAELFELIL